MRLSDRAFMLVLFGGVAAPVTTIAQVAPTPTAQAVPSSPAAATPLPAQAGVVATSSPSNAYGIQEVVVTARRRSESLETTPVAITAVSPAQLESKGSMNLTQLQGAAPSLLITTQGTGAATANISIRGIAFADVEKSFDPAVGVIIDGVYIGTSTGQLLDAFDIASLEVLRGPQGTLFGRNTIAGVLNVRRTEPTGEFGGKAEVSYGSYGDFEARGIINLPVIKDVLALKLFDFHTQSEGYYKDVYDGKNTGGDNTDNFGGSILFTPGGNFRALLTLEEQQQRFQPYVGSLIQPGDAFCGAVPAGDCGGNNTTSIYNVYPSTRVQGSYHAPAATLEMNYKAGPVRLTSVTSYRSSDENQEQDYATAGLYDATRVQKYHQFSEEVRVAGNILPTLDYVAGLYYFSSTYHLLQGTNVFGAFAGLQDTTGRAESKAAFIDLDWKFLPKWRLSGGGRYTEDTKQNINPSLYVGAANNSWSKFTPKVTLDYRPIDTIMFYGSFSEGYRSGGFNGRGLEVFSATIPYNPETVNAYEAGLKSEFFEHRLQFNIDGYYTDYKNIQESTTVTLAGGDGNQTIVSNAAGARINGVEADLTYRPIRDLTLSANAGYTNAHFHGFIVNQPVGATVRTFDLSNVDLIYAPKLTASLNADYKISLTDNLSLLLSSDYRYITAYDQQIAINSSTPIPATGTIVVDHNDPRLRSNVQSLFDASASVPLNFGPNQAKITLFCRNILDNRGPATAFDVASYPTLWAFSAAREPRVVGVQLGYTF